jgi:GNAT superfamily N-acetyltransferase
VDAHPAAFLMALCRRYPGAEWHVGGEADWFMTGIPAAQFNGVTRVRDGAGIEEACAVTTRRFRGRGVPAYWYLGPGAPPRLPDVLAHGGITERDRDIAVLLAPAEALAPDVFLPPAFEVHAVTNPRDLYRWEHAYFAHHGLRGNGTWIDTFQTVGYAAPSPFRLYLGVRGNQVAATGMAFMEPGGPAAIHAVSVARADRNTGLGRAITLTIAQRAKRAGASSLLVYAPPHGSHTLERAGFARASVLSRYRYDPPGRDLGGRR